MGSEMCIRDSLQACVIPLIDWGCVGLSDFSLGDLAMHPGSDAPTDFSTGGGAKFLRGARGSQNWEWQVNEDHYISFDIAGPLWTESQILTTAAQVVASPANHWNLPGQAGSVNVADCASGSQVSLESELQAILVGRVSGQPHNCHP